MLQHPCQKPGVSLELLSWHGLGRWCQELNLRPLVVLVPLCPLLLEERAHALSSRADLTWVCSGFSLES